MVKKLVIGLIVSTVGDSKYSEKQKVIDLIKSFQIVQLPCGDILQYDVAVSTGDWMPLLDHIEKLNISVSEGHLSDTIIKTTDTIYYESLIFSFLAERKSILLCGPPGCGKSMTILSCLRVLPDVNVLVINFSSTSTPQMLLRFLSNLCSLKKNPHGISLTPKFCKRLVGKFCIM